MRVVIDLRMCDNCETIVLCKAYLISSNCPVPDLLVLDCTAWVRPLVSKAFTVVNQRLITTALGNCRTEQNKDIAYERRVYATVKEPHATSNPPHYGF